MYVDQQRKRKRERAWKKEQTLRQKKWQAEAGNQAWDEMIEILGRMKDEWRIPIILKHYYSYSYGEISKMLNIAE
ncbi:hypothetical protein [Bacillus massiliglaciei]|uniref:hypothetical protein n=1 Tax=Bacillus massiliglaciei TaxID=1816693 RepID=UPI001F46930B|nr:hypothetical protein [Bacillus massiliglaciei]